jgi:hypothetical protein
MSFMDFLLKGESQGFVYLHGPKSGYCSFLQSRHFISMNRRKYFVKMGTTGLL